MKLIIGLGNPGLKYKNTRHNSGFIAIDALAEKNGIRFNKKRFGGVTGEGMIGGQKAVLLKPYTYMNLSGNAAREAASFYKLAPADIIVMYDDIDLDFARLRVRASGSAGSHNGMKSIVACLGSTDMARVRIGIGKPPPYMDLAAYVLQKFSRAEKKAMEETGVRAAEAAELIIKSGVEAAQSRFNAQVNN